MRQIGLGILAAGFLKKLRKYLAESIFLAQKEERNRAYAEKNPLADIDKISRGRNHLHKF